MSTFGKEKPWMTQLAAVSCLSLAAKVEETQVPLPLDFRVNMCIRSDINPVGSFVNPPDVGYLWAEGEGPERRGR
ncbi:hypothetical protein OIU77_008337 [Salix suchowensis]|uniref:B-like cyclin n=1 Tax=Salix suchowensis TaxID=1278906 RepID=A0ABQ9AK15_9ROSI|nr:hypothetical protein OIU77_008337 [Salix suchowensis]